MSYEQVKIFHLNYYIYALLILVSIYCPVDLLLKNLFKLFLADVKSYSLAYFVETIKRIFKFFQWHMQLIVLLRVDIFTFNTDLFSPNV